MARSRSETQFVWTWSAVIAGVLAALVIQVILVLLGLGVGLIAVDAPTAQAAPGATGSAALLWWVASGVFAAFVGGAIAGAHAPVQEAHSRIGHALASWALAVLIVVGAASLTAGGAANVVSNIAGPGATATTRLANINRPGAPAPTQAQLETARKAMSAAMFISFVGLLLGGIAAGLGGWWSEEMREELGATSKARR